MPSTPSLRFNRLVVLAIVLILGSALSAWAGLNEMASEEGSEESGSVSSSSSSGGGKQDPIDKAVDELLDRDPSTMGQRKAFEKGFEMWDEAMNKVYQEVMTALKSNKEAKDSLKQAQRAWIAFRDEEFKLLGAVYGAKSGTMYMPLLASSLMEFVKRRTVELRNLLELIKEE